MPKITDKQRAVLNAIKSGGAIRWYCSPGCDHGGYYFECKDNHKDVDGRTVNGLEARGFIEVKPREDVWTISAAGKAALET